MGQLSQLFKDAKGGWDEQAVLSFGGVIAFWFCVIWSVVKLGQHFDPEAVGIGFASVMGATLVGMGYRESRGAKNDGG